jgi:hypothetical protein
MGAILLLSVALGTSIAACDAPAAATSMAGEVRGVVLDQTPPVHPVAAQTVRLELVDHGSASARETTTDPRGRFTFSRLPVGGPRVFLVQVQYSGVPYTARAVLTPGVPVRDVQLTVFEPTEDRLAVHGTVAFAVVEPLQRGFRVSVIQRLQNATEFTVVATNKDPLVFPLPLVSPPPLRDEPVELVGGWHNPKVAQGTITDATPVLPGTMDVAYAFRFEPRARNATLRWLLPYGAMDVELLVARGIRASGNDMHAAGNLTERGRRYARWSGGPVRPGGAISVRLEGLLASESRWPEVVAGVLALALGCGLTAALRRRPVPREASPANGQGGAAAT